jgi:hypothetical protein
MQHQHKEHELEKPNEQYLERTGTETGSTRSPADDGNGSADYPGKGSDMEKRLLRRIDLRLVPALGESAPRRESLLTCIMRLRLTHSLPLHASL